MIRDPNKHQMWHMFAAEMALECGLNAWGRNSVIIHAVATDPMGPYVRQEELLPYFAHEPTACATATVCWRGLRDLQNWLC
eukprot:COSAG03_NODE_8925_length_759_cov_1.559091_2_plen_81_part_00